MGPRDREKKDVQWRGGESRWDGEKEVQFLPVIGIVTDRMEGRE